MLEHLDDLASDFSAIHGVRDVMLLSGPAFFRGATRLPAYRGVMRERLLAEQRDEPAQPQQSSRAQSYAPQPAIGSGPQRDAQGRDVIPATKAAIQGHPELAGIFSFG